LIDPDNQQVRSIHGFARGSTFTGGHGEGVTSVDEGSGLLFVTDRTTRRMNVVDPKAMAIISSSRLQSSPDYVRFVAETDEVWVTQPGAERIEVFRLQPGAAPKPVHSGFIAVPDGPESLIIDHAHARAYTHLWHGVTVAIRLKDRTVIARWPNGCKESRGIAVDEQRSFLFAACDEGMLAVLNSNTGKILAQAYSGDGVDIIAYNQKQGHVYLPGADSATMAIVGISAAGAATVMTTVKTTKGAHCATVDDRNRVYVCDPENGQILMFKDQFPPLR
jgi:hypothetical protein